MINVLIVEDDYRIAEIHQNFLEELDDVKIIGKALNGEEAINIVSHKDVDLVLLDLYLPDILGEKLISILRKKKRDIDFIVISAASEKEMVSKMIRSGIFDYIIKPVMKKRLLNTVVKYMEFNKSLRKNTIEQHDLDHFFGIRVTEENNDERMKNTPKGIDPLTLEKVKEIMQHTNHGITAEKLGEQIGASRTTARRYLEFLISEKEVVADLQYGTIGRPERIYYKIEA